MLDDRSKARIKIFLCLPSIHVRARRLLAWIEYFVTLAAIISLIAFAYRLPAGPGVFLAIIALSLAAWLIYRMVSRHAKPADWTDKYPRVISSRPRTNCMSCNYDCTGIEEPTCPECGKPHAIPSPPLPLKERNASCQKCRYVFAEIAGRCPECGYLIRDTPAKPFQPAPSKRMLIIGVAAATIVFTGLSAWLIALEPTDMFIVLVLGVPAWLVVMGITAGVIATGRLVRKDLAPACGKVLLVLSVIASCLIFLLVTA